MSGGTIRVNATVPTVPGGLFSSPRATLELDVPVPDSLPFATVLDMVTQTAWVLIAQLRGDTDDDDGDDGGDDGGDDDAADEPDGDDDAAEPDVLEPLDEPGDVDVPVRSDRPVLLDGVEDPWTVSHA